MARLHEYQGKALLAANGQNISPAPLWQILDAGYPFNILIRKRSGGCGIG